MIEKITTPSDICALSDSEIKQLAAEMREVIIRTVSTNGGHLASNLGMVEATVALHKSFSSPKDKIIYDVGHQCYAHKLLTGRYSDFQSLRRFGGISGFTSPAESEHDIFYEGHSGASVSAALGIATANKLKGNADYTVAVVGDGSLTNGMIYEAFNNCADKELDLIIVINDNEMSISPNVGGLHNYLTRLRTSNGYFSFKRRFEHALSAIPVVGFPLAKGLKLIKDGIKRFFIKDTIFEDLGLIYLGPVDGHDISRLCDVFAEAKQKHRCCVVHMLTEKGRGYQPAQDNPDKYHSVGMFDADDGVELSVSTESFSSRAGDALCRLACEDERICAVTAAMCDGTGLTRFASEYPERFFDVGIAEEHAITFAGGLSAGGMLPAVALYSTFSQRVYDQLLHDVAIQGLPLLLLLDRSGIVSGDGITHQGIFDYALFSSIPGINIYAPVTYRELEEAVQAAVSEKQLAIVRYPKGREYAADYSGDVTDGAEYCCIGDTSECEIVFVTYGTVSRNVVEAVAILGGEHTVGIIRLKKIFPIDTAALDYITRNARLVIVVEEGIVRGGVGEKLAAAFAGSYSGRRICVKAIDGFIPHGTVDELTRLTGLDGEALADFARKRLNAVNGARISHFP